MRPASFAIVAMAGLTLTSAGQAEPSRAQAAVSLPPVKQEWSTQSAPGDADIIASFKHTDGAALAVICSPDNKRLIIAFQAPQAKWTVGQGIDVVALPDSGQQVSPSYGIATGPTQLVLKHDAVFDVWTMAQAKDFFKFSAGDFARVFPVANFRSAVAPVLRACGDQ